MAANCQTKCTLFRVIFQFLVDLKVIFVAVSTPQTALPNIFCRGDIAETVEGTLGDFLYKIGSILGPNLCENDSSKWD